MQKIYEIKDNKLTKVNKAKENFWIDLINPKEEELNEISKKLQIEKKDILKALDKSEIPHIEYEEKETLYIINIPYVKESTTFKKYRAYPFGIFFLKNGILTVSLTEHPIRNEIKKSIEDGLDFKNSKTFPIFFILKSVEYYLKYLNEIQDNILKLEKTLIKSSSNKDLERMLALQKSLLYFTTSLQGNSLILEKQEKNEKLSNKELDLLKDTQIELKQALEMTTIYREILENTMGTYSSIISNNLNDTMKFLTSITLVISVPTMISSFLGMNVNIGEFGKNPYSFLIMVLLSILITIILIIILKKKNLL